MGEDLTGKAGAFWGTVPWGPPKVKGHNLEATQKTRSEEPSPSFLRCRLKVRDPGHNELEFPSVLAAGLSVKSLTFSGASRARTRTRENTQDCFRWSRRWAKRKVRIYENVEIDRALKLRFRDFFLTFHFRYFYFLFSSETFQQK